MAKNRNNQEKNKTKNKKSKNMQSVEFSEELSCKKEAKSDCK